MSRAIEASGLGKRYQLGQHTSPDTLVETLLGVRARRGSAPREIWALRDVSFSVDQGEVVGVVGPNGAGKSTLLKILARITDPTEGRARMRGRVGALLEVGTAFHMELTGRENIVINGSLLGMSRRDVRDRFDAIVEFAGVSEFLDTPLKRFSSGMYLRLAFAVAAHYEPDVVVIDEVLAVGDAEFQRRCLGKMSEFGREGRTVLFVSHDLGSIGRLCSRAIWIEHGGIRQDGPARAVLHDYLAAVTPSPALGDGSDPTSAGRTVVGEGVQVTLLGPNGKAGNVHERGTALTVAIELRRQEPTLGLELAIWVTDAGGLRILDEALFDDAELSGRLDRPGEYRVTLGLPSVLPAGEYVLGLWLGTAQEVSVETDALRFSVLPRADDRSEMQTRRRVAGPIGTWRVE